VLILNLLNHRFGAEVELPVLRSRNRLGLETAVSVVVLLLQRQQRSGTGKQHTLRKQYNSFFTLLYISSKYSTYVHPAEKLIDH